jgi:hypothetical protein
MAQDRLASPGPEADPDDLRRAENAAAENGLSGFCAWRMGLERRYTVMPPWYWNDQQCKRRYISHIRAAIDWQRREHRINRANAVFLSGLSGRPAGRGPETG